MPTEATHEGLSADELDRLLETARASRSRAYAPYSGFRVGAALLTGSGEVVTGCNVENASYGLAICAERVAVAKAVSEGIASFRAIAICGPDEDLPCFPCGSCRQVLHEFAPNLVVVTAGGPGAPARVTPLPDLLPMPFGPERLSPHLEDG